MKLIDADTLKEEIEYYIQEAGWDEAHNEALEWCLEFIDNQTTIEPERKTGKWIDGPDWDIVIERYCSECGQLLTSAKTVRMKFCPNCGAKMEEGEQDG